MNETIILDQIIKSKDKDILLILRLDNSELTDPLKAGFPATCCPGLPPYPPFTFAAVPLTLLTTGVCGSEFSLPTCVVVWPATLTQLLHFTEGETEAQRAFLNSVLITVLRLGVEFLSTVF